MQSVMDFLWPRFGAPLIGLVLAAAIWIPSLQFFFRPTKLAFSADGTALAEAQLKLWRNPALKSGELEAMRGTNSEWDFMGRTFLVLALGEMCVRDSSLKTEYLPIMDAIIDETISLEKEHGMHCFLMPYSRSQPYRVQPERSLFIDGEIAMMLATRRIVEEKAAYKTLLEQRAKLIEKRLSENKSVAVESYPNECWLFDHSIALAALRLEDYLDGTDHRALASKWLETARQRLTHPASGMFVSSYTTNAEWLDGPEGSSIWAAAHFLRFVDPVIAKEQYYHARCELARMLWGFGWSREWPVSWRNWLDVDSGAVIPILDCAAGASGMALLGAASFRDVEFYRTLKASLNFAAFPIRNHGALRYSASNAVGDAALLYAETTGAIWEKVHAQNH